VWSGEQKVNLVEQSDLSVEYLPESDAGSVRSSKSAHPRDVSDLAAGAPFGARVRARLFPGRFDAELADGERVAAGSATAVHAQRLVSVRERETLARSLRQCLQDAREGDDSAVMFSSRVRVHRRNVLAAEDLIDAVTMRLHSPRPVSPRGMALLRRLLTDGGSPLYELGSGDIEVRLAAALATL
jgi:hypothetical protein